MTFLAVIGLIALCIPALYLTFASIVWFFSASAFGDALTGPTVMGLIAVGLWTLVWYLSPLTIVVKTI